MGASNPKTAATDVAHSNALEDAYAPFRLPLERFRYGQEFCLASRHVYLAGMVVREVVEGGQSLARGIHVFLGGRGPTS